MLSDDIVLCCNPSCTSHQTRLDEISNQLVTCLKSAADFTIPSAGAGRHPRVAGWSQFVKPELTAIVSGGISFGWMLVLPQLVFCFSLKSVLIGGTNMLFVESGEKRSISSEQGLLKLCSMILIAIFGLKCVGLLAIINLFLHLLLMVSLVQKILLTCGAVHFKQLYNTVDGSASTDLLSALDSGISHDELDRISILAEVIEVAIGKLKRGKSDGDTLMSDHIIEALLFHLSISSTLVHINAETWFYAIIVSRCYYSANTQRV